MPIIAVCPYCHKGRVRAPERAVGMSYPCPQCHSHFTLCPSGEAEVAAARSSGKVSHPPPRPAPAAAVETATYPVATAADLPPPEYAPEPDPAPIVLTSTGPPPAKVTDPGLPWALVALTLAGVGLALSQVPYGRLLTAAFAAAGLAVAVLGVLAADRKKLVPAAACGLNLLAGLIAFALPGWLGQSGWLPPRAETAPRQVLSVGHAGGDRAPAEWVDGSSASWQQDDVRVSVMSAAVGPVELLGPKDAKKWPKEKLLKIKLRIVNVGVARRFEFQGWSAAAPAGTGPRVTDSTGKVLPAKTFDPGWGPAGAGDPKPLFPGKTAEYLLVFEPPTRGAEYVRVELPGAAFGGEHPVRLQIPAAFIGTR